MERGRQMRRQWALLLALNARRMPASTRELWERLSEEGHDCSEKTVRRDLLDLEDAGFVDSPARGRWTVSASQRNLVPQMSRPEVVAFLVWHRLRPTPLMQEQLASLASKLRANLPQESRDWVDRLATRVRATDPRPVTVPAVSGIHEDIARATNEHRVMRIRYWSASTDREEDRVVEPYLLWHAMGGVYVVAHDRKRAQVRTFALQRIRSLEVTEERFVPSARFDALEFTGRGFGVLHDGLYRFEVELHRDIAFLVRERTWHESQRVVETGFGCLVTWEMSGLMEVARWVAGLGGYARVRAPEELRTRVRLIHEEGLEVD